MIAITILSVFIYGFIEIGNGTSDVVPKVPFSNVPGTAIGFSAYSYEGIGLVLPVQDITADPKIYKKIVVYVVITVCIVYLTFGWFCVQAWESNINSPLITD